MGGINSIGIGFVLPDFRRPSTIKQVGVCVVALFHGGEVSIFLFFEGGFGVSRDACTSWSFLLDSSDSVGLRVESLGSVEIKMVDVIRTLFAGTAENYVG